MEAIIDYCFYFICLLNIIPPNRESTSLGPTEVYTDIYIFLYICILYIYTYSMYVGSNDIYNYVYTRSKPYAQTQTLNLCVWCTRGLLHIRPCRHFPYLFIFNFSLHFSSFFFLSSSNRKTILSILKHSYCYLIFPNSHRCRQTPAVHVTIVVSVTGHSARTVRHGGQSTTPAALSAARAVQPISWLS